MRLTAGLLPLLLALLLAAAAAPALASEDGAIVTGTGETLCPWGDELPAGSDLLVGEDNTRNAREWVFGEAPPELAATQRLQASWSAYTDGGMGHVSPGCSVYLFDSAAIDGIWEWFADSYPDRSAPAPDEEPAPSGAPGEGGRLFHFPPSWERESWTYVFRSLNVIAAVSLDVEVGSGAGTEAIVPLAQAVARRIDAAAAGEPLPAAPSPTPEPAFPTPAEADLLAHVPEAFRESCSRTRFAVSAAALAGLTCGVGLGDGWVTVTYQQFGDPADLAETYQNTLSFMGVTNDSGPCAEAWPGEGPYSVGDTEAGRAACSEYASFVALISWTDERHLVSGYAEGFDVEREELYAWWTTDSGPVYPSAGP